MEHFPLRQNMILTASFFFARDSTYSIKNISLWMIEVFSYLVAETKD
jgi:hypothetical protein